MKSPEFTSFKFPVTDFKRLETPLDRHGYRNYYCTVDVLDLPNMAKWNKSNVRDAKARGKVPQAIRESLIENQLFGYGNRGITLMAEKVDFDNKSKTVEVCFDGNKKHGIYDGGHTRLILDSEKENLLSMQEQQDESLNRFVRVEILVGFNSMETTYIAGARNTSNQVRDESILEQQGKFGEIKDALRGQPYYDDIAFKEYELYDGNPGRPPKPISIKDIIAILSMFNTRDYSSLKHPVQAYSQKSECLKRFGDDVNRKDSVFKKLAPMLPTFLYVHDLVHLTLPSLYKDYARKYRDDVSRGDFGRLKGVVYKEGKPVVKLAFTGEESKYRIPNPYVYPILAGFRAFLREDAGHYDWIEGFDPKTALEGEFGHKMAQALTDVVGQGSDPNSIGKNLSYWSACFDKAENYMLKYQTPARLTA